MVQLFLCGGRADNAPGIELVQLFATQVLRTESKRVLYIPIAMPEMTYKGVEWTYKLLHGLHKKSFSSYGIDQVDMWVDISGRSYSELAAYGGVYIGGGNAFDLLQSMRESGFEKLLERYIREGGIVYGCSAGAMVLGAHIGTARLGGDPDTDETGMTNLDSLNLADGRSISCHYRPEDDNEIGKYVNDNGSDVIALPENTGVRITDEGITVIGDADAYLFTKSGRSTLKIGSMLRKQH